jgi:hypothetical protein
MTAEIVGVHPYAENFPLLPDSELDELAESIRTIGLLHPIVITQDGLIIDGRNRLEACNRARVQATTEIYEGEDIAEYVIAANVARRNMTTGQRAMVTAVVLQAAGRRENGRWKRTSVDIHDSVNSDNWRNVMAKAGAVLDVAERADSLGPEFAVFIEQPQKVISGDLTLDAAHRIAQDFEQKAAMAEMALWLPFTQAAGELEQLAIEAEEAAAELPTVDAPLKKEYRKQLEKTAKHFTAAATRIRVYLKEDTTNE